MERTRMTEVSIMSLRITSEDEWLDDYIRRWGAGVRTSPNYQFLMGNTQILKGWFDFLNLDWLKRAYELLDVYMSIKEFGQLEPIKIYRDNRINTGHKRAAIMLFLGYENIKAEIVEDEHKL